MAGSKQRVLNPDLDEAPPRPPKAGNGALTSTIAVFAALAFAGLVWLYFGGAGNAPLVAPEAKSFKVRGEGPAAADPPAPADRAVYDVMEGQGAVARSLPPEALAKAEAAGAPAPMPPLAAPAQPPKSEPKEPTPPKPPAPTADAPAGMPSRTGPVVVQLAALRSPDAARALFVRVQDKVPAAAGAILIVQPVSQPSGQMFRVRIGHFADRTNADAFCASLRAQSFDCQVIAP
jgi:cell division septation protein DedD